MSDNGLNELRDECYAISLRNGFHDGDNVLYRPPTQIAPKLLLINSEIGEATEALRQLDWETKPSEHVPTMTAFEEEIADVIIRVMDMCGWLGIDIERCVADKMAFNRTRPYKHNKTF